MRGSALRAVSSQSAASCDEIAMVRTVLEHLPPAGDLADSHEELRYEVPTPLVQLGKRVS